MSYDLTEKIIQRRNLAEADLARLTFLEALKKSATRLTPWEDQFMNDLVGHPRPLTPRQRESVDEMRTKYGHEL